MKHSFTVILCLFASALAWSKDVNVTTAGQLHELITDDEKFTITELTISGNLNGADIMLIREMAGVDSNGFTTAGKLETLDMSKAHIVAGTSTYKGSFATKDNIVGESMFSQCSKLVTVKLSETVTEIEKDAFSDCSSMTTIALPVTLTAIGDAAFVNSGLTEVTIPEGVTKISDYLFYYSVNLATINLPSTVISIGEEAFTGCPIVNINVAEGNSTFATVDDVLSTVDKAEILLYPSAREEQTYVFPSTTRRVGATAFKEAQLYSVVMNEGLEEIKESGFENCSNLQAVNMPNSLTKIGAFAFNKCSNVESIIISTGLTELPENAFGHCTKLDNVTIPDNIGKIGTATFSNCKNLKTITLPNTLETLDQLAFNECQSLESITIPNSVKTLDKGVFYHCINLSNVTLPSDIESISYQLFAGCTSLKQVEIPEKVKDIRGYAFQGAGLEKVNIPKSCNFISDGAFMDCRKLAEIDNYNPTPQELGMLAFAAVPATCILYVPQGAKQAYQEADEWKDFDIREMETTAIESVNADGQVTETARYNLQGERLATPQKGINLIYMSNGQVKKVLVQ